MNRREFISWVGISAIATSLPMAIAACSPDTKEKDSTVTSSTSSNNSSAGDNFVKVGTVAELDQVGFLKTKVAGKPAIIIRDPANKASVQAFNPTCTHNGCAVEWKAAQKVFNCPCHGSQFAANGNAVKGPADTPLKRYSAKLQGDSILVQA